MASTEATHQHADSPAPATNGRTWAYAGMTVGALVSEYANVAHSYVPPAHTPHWTPQPGAVAFAAFWPIALLIAVEILARTRWRESGWWIVIRAGGMLPVAAVAAVASYRHLSGLLAFYREDRLIATWGPISVDGLMVMATAALIATAGVTTAPLSAPEPVPVPLVTPGPVKPAAKPVRPRPRKTGRVVKTDAELVIALGELIAATGGIPSLRVMTKTLGVAERRLPGLIAQVNGTKVSP